MGAMGAVTSYLKGDLGGVFSSLSGVGKKIMNTNSGAADRAKQMNTSPAGKDFEIRFQEVSSLPLVADCLFHSIVASLSHVADVISWSGCKDIQTSADATEAGKATGAMVSNLPFQHCIVNE